VIERGHLLAALPDACDRERFELLVESAAVRIERIVSGGQRSEDGRWYEQERAEWVLVLRGRAAIELEGDPEAVELRPGEWLEIPARRRHRVAWTADDEPTVWLAVHHD